MARFRASPIVSTVSGCIGGVEFAQGKSTATVKLRRRTRRTTSPRQVAAIATASTIRDLHRAQPTDFQLAWTTYAQQTPYPNGLGQKMSCTGFQSFQWFHSLIWDALDRPAGFTIPVQPPPPASPAAYPIVLFSANFNVNPGAYFIVFAQGGVLGYTVEILYAARRGSGAKGGATNFRYIGGQPWSGSPLDWRPWFEAPRCNWFLAPGEHVLLRVQHVSFTTAVLTPSNQWTEQTLVV